MISFTLGWKRNRPCVYSAGRAIVGGAKRRPLACRREACCHICVLGTFLNTIALPAEWTHSLFLSQPSVKEIGYFLTNPKSQFFPCKIGVLV